MKASKSQLSIRQSTLLTRSISSRYIYVNQQPLLNTKDVATIFHSPFKNGQKNPTYTNPTFMSSHLFYPKEYIKEDTKHNIKETNNQKKKRQLYQQRMKKSEKSLSSVSPVCRRSRLNQSCLSKNENNQCSGVGKSKLQHELSEVTSYHMNIKSNPTTKNTEKEQYPIYADKNKVVKEKQKHKQNEKDLKQFVNLTNQIKRAKNQENKRQKAREMSAMQSQITRNNIKNKQNYDRSRKNASLLANILKQQIQVYKEKQNRERKTLVNFN